MAKQSVSQQITHTGETAKVRIDRIIGTNIRRERTSRKLTRWELGQAVGLSVAHIGLIERGERGATNVVLERLRDFLEVPMDMFFDEFLGGKTAPASARTKGDAKQNLQRKQIHGIIDTLPDAEIEVLYLTITGLDTLGATQVKQL